MKILYFLLSLILFAWILYSIDNPTITIVSVVLLLVITAIVWGKRK